MNDLYRKLMLKPGYRAALLYAPQDFPRTESDLPAGVHLADETSVAHEPPQSFDLVHLFVHSAKELAERTPLALSAVKERGLLWISYPKKSSKIKTDIHRDVGWDAVKKTGMEGVSLISVDDTWSAMRFRRADEVGK